MTRTKRRLFPPDVHSDARDCFFVDDNILHVLTGTVGGTLASLLHKKLKGVHDAFKIRQEMTQTMGGSSFCVSLRD